MEYDSDNSIEYTYDNAGNLLQHKAAWSEPDITIVPGSYDYGNVEAGTSSTSKTFTASNQGNVDLDIGELTLSNNGVRVFITSFDFLMRLEQFSSLLTTYCLHLTIFFTLFFLLFTPSYTSF